MSKEDIIKELLSAINDTKEVSDMSFSTAKELTSLVRMLQCA